MIRIFVVFSVIAAIAAQLEPVLYHHLVEDVSHIRPLNDEEYLLPGTTIPYHYDVKISTKIDEGIFDFEGEVTIHIEDIHETNIIVLHTRNLTIDEIHVYDETRLFEYEIIEPPYYNEHLEFLEITLKDFILVPGDKYVVHILYNGVLRGVRVGNSNDEAGFYRGSYTNAAGELVWLATTQFESTDARHGFPCYDEPKLKATFSIAITHGCKYNAVSNMPESKDVNSDGTCTTSFEKTPPMSTYLIAYIVSDYDMFENYAGPILTTRTKHRILARDYYTDSVTLPLLWSEQTIDDLNEFLHTPYTFPKMDQIGLSQFAAGAMENWGLVTYRETSLYYNKDKAAYGAETGVHGIIAHEYGHQWFGNLVSPAEWGYLWLNEGFANLFGSLIPHRLFPETRDMDTFATGTCYTARESDAATTTRPMSWPVYDPVSISNSFDNIAYAKSGCVLDMFRHALTEERFRKGLSYYLAARQYKEGHPDYLAEGLNTAAHEGNGVIPDDVDFKTILDSWHLQAGVPILNVNYNRETGAIKLEQKRYLRQPPANPDESIWWIPYNFISTTEAGDAKFEYTTPDGWLTTAEATIEPSDVRNWKGDNWVVFNKQQTGYYRVNYDKENWLAIAEGLKTENAGDIPYLSRAQLIADAHEFVQRNMIDIEILLAILEYLPEREDDYFPWKMAFPAIVTIQNRLIGSDSYSSFKLYANKLTAKPYELYGVVEQADEDFFNNYARRSLIEWACKTGSDKCKNDATEALKKHIDGTVLISNFLRVIVQAQGVRKLDTEYCVKLWIKQQAATVTSERNELINALGATENPDARSLLLTSTITANGESLQGVSINYSNAERALIFAAIANHNPEAIEELIEFLVSNNEKITTLVGGNVESIFSNLVSRIRSDSLLAKFEQLATAYPTLKTKIDEFIVTIESNIEKVKEDDKNLGKWLKDNYPTENGAQAVYVSWALIVSAVMAIWVQY